MTPTLLSFYDVTDVLRYINLNNIEVIKMEYVPNTSLKKIRVRYQSGEVISYDIRESTAENIKKKLKCFTIS